MLVREVMHSPAIATTVDASVKDVAIELSFHRFSGLPVDDRNGHVIGIITEADIVRGIMEGKNLAEVSVEQLMTRNPYRVKDTDQVMEVVELLTDHRIVRVPVVRDGRLIGIVSRSDLIRAALHEGFKGF